MLVLKSKTTLSRKMKYGCDVREHNHLFVGRLPRPIDCIRFCTDLPHRFINHVFDRNITKITITTTTKIL